MAAPGWSGYRAFFDDPVNVTDPTGHYEVGVSGFSHGYGEISGAAAIDFSGSIAPLDEFVRYKNSKGEWVTQRISGEGGNFTDIIHTVHGRIPEADATITTEYIENENLGHRIAPGVFIGGTELGLDVLNVSDLFVSKGVAVASFKLLVRNIGKVASKGAPRYLYHYTNKTAAQNISKVGLQTKYSSDGFLYQKNIPASAIKIIK